MGLALVASALALPGGRGDAALAPAADSGWLKPGFPFSHQFPDPAVFHVGPIAWGTSTVQGGAHLPMTWSGQYNVWVARADYAGSPYSSDPYLNDALVSFPPVPQTIFGHPWLRHEIWAPSVGRVGSGYVAYLSYRMSASNERFCIYTATSTGPAGPYSTRSAPLVCRGVNEPPGQNSTTNVNGYIDPDLFTDPQGGNWLLFKSEGGSNANYPKVWTRKLNASGTGFLSTGPTQLLTVTPGTWEGTVVENPSMVKFGPKYLLFYSGNEYRSDSYAIGYALCDGPRGPCWKPSNSPLLKSVTGAYGPGAPDAFLDGRRRLLLAYHAWRCKGGAGATCSDGKGNRRLLHVAELDWNASKTRIVVVARDQRTGGAAEALWTFAPGGVRTKFTTATFGGVSGAYTPAAGDFYANGAGDEILFYGLGSGNDFVMRFNGDMTTTRTSITQSSRAFPVTGDFDGDGNGDVFWYTPGDRALVGHPDVQPDDELWLSNGTQMGDQQLTLPKNGFGFPVAGDFTGDGATDILWVTPGATAESLWEFSPHAGAGVDREVVILGNELTTDGVPVVGDFDGDDADEIVWYRVGDLRDAIWNFAANGAPASSERAYGGTYQPFAGDFDGNGVDDIYWYAPGTAADSITWYPSGTAGPALDPSLTGRFTPVVGDFDGNGADDVFFYR